MSTTPESTANTVTSDAQMNAVVIERFGGIDELTERSIPIPVFGDDDVLIRVEVAGAGSWDLVEREGEYDAAMGGGSPMPYILGWDGAGTVAAVGRNVARFKLGDRVYGATRPMIRGGFYAEYAVLDAQYVGHVPERMSMEEAGALAWDALTAQSGIESLDPKPGQTLMVFGASGGIGHIAVQLARHAGMRVLAVASGDDGVALAKRLGAEAVVDGRKEYVLAAAAQFAPDGLDAALITAGGETTQTALAAVKASGQIAWTNGVYPLPEPLPAAPVSYFDAEWSLAAIERLNAIIEASDFEIHVDEIFPLAQVKDAHRAIANHYVGKLALRIAPGASDA